MTCPECGSGLTQEMIDVGVCYECGGLIYEAVVNRGQEVAGKNNPQSAQGTSKQTKVANQKSGSSSNQNNGNNGGCVFGFLILIILLCWLVSTVSSCGPDFDSKEYDDYFWSREETWESFAEWNAKQ